MKPGDLVTLCPRGYPRYKGQVGMLVEAPYPGRWIVMIGGSNVDCTLHPYLIGESFMEAVK